MKKILYEYKGLETNANAAWIVTAIKCSGKTIVTSLDKDAKLGGVLTGAATAYLLRLLSI